MDEAIQNALAGVLRANAVAADERAVGMFAAHIEEQGVDASDDDAVSTALAAFLKANPAVPVCPNFAEMKRAGKTAGEREAATRSWTAAARRWKDAARLPAYIAETVSGKPHRRGSK